MILRYFFTAAFSFVLSAAFLFARDGPIAFDHITIKNGLSDGRIDCILQDSHGFLWFGTQDGLNRYDGYNFTVLDHDIFDSTSISSNWIRCILEDRFYNLWIGTEGGGLNRFNRETATFTRWIHEPDNPQSLMNNFVRTLFEDRSGTLWIGTLSGLSRFDREGETFLPFRSDPSDPDSPIFDENVTKIYQDSELDLWIGTGSGLYRYNKKNKKLKYITDIGTEERIEAIFEDKYKNIWIGSRYNGLYKYDRVKQKFARFRESKNDPNSLNSDEIKAIYIDRHENLWIGTMHGGLNLFDFKSQQFRCYKNDPADPSSLSSNSVRTIYQDRTGVLWIGMDGSGINMFIRERRKFELYGNRADNLHDLSNNTITSIYEDSKGILWIGTEGGGLDRFSRKKEICRHYRTNRENPHSISSDQVTSIFEDRKDLLWIGTKDGLNKFDRKKAKFYRYYNNNTPITGNNYINFITEGKSGQLLIGTNNGVNIFNKKTYEFRHLDYGDDNILNNEAVGTIWVDGSGVIWIGHLRSGLVKFNPETQDYTHYRADAGKSNSLSNNFVQYIHQDRAGHFWIATRKGLNKFDPSARGFNRYTKADGLPSNVIVGILEYPEGNLWLSTTNGLSKFDTKQETFTNYDMNDGLQGNQFSIRSCFKSQSGELFFGGNNGFNSFYPDSMVESANPHIPPIVITNVKILNKPSFQGVHENTSLKDTVNLTFNENQISFEFAALDFTRPEKNQFAYMLEGLDGDWIFAGTRRYANYTNLDPGYYTFKVKGTNSDGVWNEKGTSLTIYISTPFWKTWWAYILYGVLAIGFIYGVNVYIIGMVRVKHDLKIERMEKEKVKEINQFKLQFFTDVAHEFKTPLTLIQAPLEGILATIKNGFPFEEEYRLMYRNVKYLLRLVHQLLYFRRAEQGRMELKVSKGDVVQFVKEVFELFCETARKHHIVYQFDANSEAIEGWFDWEKLEEILVNIIDNAFKYTPDKGTISVRLLDSNPDKNGTRHVTICVNDTGVGIGKDELNHIFERFYHAKDGHHPNQASSGLGLALTRRLVQLHHGEIFVESEENKGSSFTINLPLGKAHFSDEEIITHIKETYHFRSLMKLPSEELASGRNQALVSKEKNDSDNGTLILIIEDNLELRAYMKKTLARKYRVAEAGDGKEGFEKAKELMPNMIISDIMMPYVDGLELCRRLKEDITTSHIPIILLTAKTAIEHKIEGIEIGADDYIEKPFHFRFLEARIKNLLKSREKLRERYRKEFIMEPKEVAVFSIDEKFLKSVMEFIDERLTDPDLEVKDLTTKVGMSRTMLFRKLNELTGYTPKELIRIIRLRKATQLLRKSDFTVSEIAYQVGFNYPKYFSTCFLQQFGITPSEYRKQDEPKI